MIDWLMNLARGSTAEVLFLSICVLGGVISAASLIFGGDSDGDVDEVDFGDDADVDGDGPGLLSVRGLSLLATGFGGVAYLVQHYTGRLLLASGSGLLSGLLFAAVGLAFVRLFFRQQASSLMSPQQIRGAKGVVTTAIPAGGTGEVRLTVAGQQFSRPARAEGDAEIAGNSLVEVAALLGGVVVVRKVP